MKPRLFDPRTGYRLTPQGHRALLALAKRQLKAALARRRIAQDKLERVRQRIAVVRWQHREANAVASADRWADLIQRLEDQLRTKTVEYEGKAGYKSTKDRRAWANWNVRMRFTGVALPSDREVKAAFADLFGAGLVRPGWQWSYIEWSNTHRREKQASDGWSNSTDPRDLDWLHTIWIGGDMQQDDIDTLVIGEVER